MLREQSALMKRTRRTLALLLVGGVVYMIFVWHIPQGLAGRSPFSVIKAALVLTDLFLILLWGWWPAKWKRIVGLAFHIRQRYPLLRWIGLAISAGLVPYAVLYSTFTDKFTWLSVRWLLLLNAGTASAFFCAPDDADDLTFRDVLGGVLLAGVTFAFLSAYVNVSSVPFGLTWSEGNRLWDYSLRFARNRYNL